MIRWTSLFLSCAVALTFVLADGSTELCAGHPPYQDRFFTADSKPLRGDLSADYTVAGQVPFASGSQGGCNGQGGNCPKPTAARLQLWVPDEAIVSINGQRTKPQSLGGVHKHSRIYNLEGLATGAKAAEIMVELCDQHGHAEHMQYILLAEAGQRYEVHYPAGFTLIELPVMAEPQGMPQVIPPAIQATPYVPHNIEHPVGERLFIKLQVKSPLRRYRLIRKLAQSHRLPATQPNCPCQQVHRTQSKRPFHSESAHHRPCGLLI